MSTLPASRISHKTISGRNLVPLPEGLSVLKACVTDKCCPASRGNYAFSFNSAFYWKPCSQLMWTSCMLIHVFKAFDVFFTAFDLSVRQKAGSSSPNVIYFSLSAYDDSLRHFSLVRGFVGSSYLVSSCKYVWYCLASKRSTL